MCRREVYLDRQALGLSFCWTRCVRKETGELVYVILTVQQAGHQSAGNGMGNSR